MSLKNMAIKMALAFAAAKGVKAFQQSGGMAGIKDKLAKSNAGRGGQGGGFGDLLGQLGVGGASGTGSTGGQTENSIGGILGGLAGLSGGAQGQDRMRGLLDTTAETPEDTPEEEQVSGLMIRAMIQAARADGEIDEQERATLMEVIGGSDSQEIAFVQKQMADPVNPESLARDTPKGHEVEVYTASVVAIEPDNRAEAEYLDRLAKALKIDQQKVNDIHEAQGKPPLYTL